jgi:hypothetical protein
MAEKSLNPSNARFMDTAVAEIAKMMPHEWVLETAGRSTLLAYAAAR